MGDRHSRNWNGERGQGTAGTYLFRRRSRHHLGGTYRLLRAQPASSPGRRGAVPGFSWQCAVRQSHPRHTDGWVGGSRCNYRVCPYLLYLWQRGLSALNPDCLNCDCAGRIQSLPLGCCTSVRMGGLCSCRARVLPAAYSVRRRIGSSLRLAPNGASQNGHCSGSHRWSSPSNSHSFMDIQYCNCRHQLLTQIALVKDDACLPLHNTAARLMSLPTTCDGNYMQQPADGIIIMGRSWFAQEAT